MTIENAIATAELYYDARKTNTIYRHESTQRVVRQDPRAYRTDAVRKEAYQQWFWAAYQRGSAVWLMSARAEIAAFSALLDTYYSIA